MFNINLYSKFKHFASRIKPQYSAKCYSVQTMRALGVKTLLERSFDPWIVRGRCLIWGLSKACHFKIMTTHVEFQWCETIINISIHLHRKVLHAWHSRHSYAWLQRAGDCWQCWISLQTSSVKLKSRENLFIHNSHVECKVVLKFYTEHGSITVVFCDTFENDWPSDRYVMKQEHVGDVQKSSASISECLQSHAQHQLWIST